MFEQAGDGFALGNAGGFIQPVPAELLFTVALIVALLKSRLAAPGWVTAPPLITVVPSNSSVPALF